MFKFGEPVCVPIVGPEKQWRFDSKKDIGIYIGQLEGTVYSGRVYFPWTGKVLVRRSLSEIVAMEDAIKKWIGVRDEMLKGGLSGGQMLVKLTEELINAKDKLIKSLQVKR